MPITRPAESHEAKKKSAEKTFLFYILNNHCQSAKTGMIIGEKVSSFLLRTGDSFEIPKKNFFSMKFFDELDKLTITKIAFASSYRFYHPQKNHFVNINLRCISDSNICRETFFWHFFFFIALCSMCLFSTPSSTV